MLTLLCHLTDRCANCGVRCAQHARGSLQAAQSRIESEHQMQSRGGETSVFANLVVSLLLYYASLLVLQYCLAGENDNTQQYCHAGEMTTHKVLSCRGNDNTQSIVMQGKQQHTNLQQTLLA